MKKYLIVALLMISTNILAQEVGYLTGMTKQGISPHGFQPLYGFLLSKKINDYFVLESTFLYSQRMHYTEIQADYFTFSLVPKIGYFKKAISVYLTPTLSLNPTINHVNPQNHTYLSITPMFGGQWRILPRTFLDARIGYDMGVTYSYKENGRKTSYEGVMLVTSIKFSLK